MDGATTQRERIDPPAPARLAGTLGWATFLGCSWTWCIGMFLPVILVREFGFWAWVVFAIPNVVGAAAMGWVLNRPTASAQIVARHADACAFFSVITILFHLLFLGWIVSGLVGQAMALGLTAAAVVLMAGLAAVWPAAVVWLSVVIWLFSATTFACLFARSPSFPAVAAPSAGALWLAPVCLFGFALCPYLDLTFHQARQANSAAGSRGAFTLGFGVCFFLMTVFTLWYSRLAVPGGLAPARAVAWAIGAHMMVQTAFTLVVHGRALAALGQPGTNSRGRAGLRVGCVAGLAPFFAVIAAGQFGRTPWVPWEIGYRLFLSFYGLVFPAYVWLHMVPSPWSGATPRGLLFTLLVICVAAPFYWLGFIDQKMPWLAAGVAIALLAKVIPGTRSAPRGTST